MTMNRETLNRKLRYWLKPKEQIFADLAAFVLDKDDKRKHRLFVDRGASVLFVAHLDTVQKPKFVRESRSKKTIYAQGLDDRLGCLLAVELSQELSADLLLTDYEESGRTTIQYHEIKDYNWIVELDREGSDVVTYDLDCDEFRQALREYWQIGFGTYSDICTANTNACCFNLGIGYELAHSKDSYCNVKTVFKQIDLFKEFYAKYQNQQFVRDFVPHDVWWDRCGWQDDMYEEDYCDLCGMSNAQRIYEYYVCSDCMERMIFERLYQNEEKIV